ncbi:uncharacterized protein LOC119687434 [Teleopsis dalmanni]|uniref:uncharacterized protein LOC119687434 n=1 Tax=Teleopsis dalmanni TaxID=139649 RepID=UPI0018CD1310|nr:uncharacterized protein LOC119687434 [Teleopsis dalmanni]
MSSTIYMPDMMSEESFGTHYLCMELCIAVIFYFGAEILFVYTKKFFQWLLKWLFETGVWDWIGLRDLNAEADLVRLEQLLVYLIAQYIQQHPGALREEEPDMHQLDEIFLVIEGYEDEAQVQAEVEEEEEDEDSDDEYDDLIWKMGRSLQFYYLCD